MASSKEKYEFFLIHNVSTISTLESTLRSITWFLPGRFKDAEIASEALTALLNVMSMYHDTLLARIVKNQTTYRPLIPPSLHARFTKAWADKDAVYKWTARTLEVIRFTELVFEMSLRRKVSERNKWRAIILLEAIKAALRILLLRLTRRPLVTPPIPEREFDPTSLASTENVSQSTSTSMLDTPEHLANNHIPISVHPLLVNEPNSNAEDYLLPKALSSSSVRPSLSLIQTLSGPRDWLAETAYILRPLVYASLLFADRVSSRRTNRPLVITLVLEFLSRNLRRTPAPSAVLERSEYARRDKAMLWYLLRGSIWENHTKPRIESLISSSSRTPLVGGLFGLLGSLAKDWIPLIDDYYYYTAP